MDTDRIKQTVKGGISKLPVAYDGKRIHKETGSPFDRTEYVGREVAGEHPKAPDTSFLKPGERSPNKSSRSDPTDFLRGGTGGGGTSSVAVAKKAEERRSKLRARESEGGPPSGGSTTKRPNPPNSELRRHYERSDLPVIIQQGARNKLSWKVEPERLDFHHYLPLFMSGLREVEEPYHFVAEEGVYDLLRAGGEAKVLPVLPQLVMPIKMALNTRDPKVMVRALRVLQALVDLGDGMGAALVPYYRQLLPVMNIYIHTTQSLGDRIDYHQRHGHIGEVIRDTLMKMEARGGPNATVNIKYLIPTWGGPPQ